MAVAAKEKILKKMENQLRAICRLSGNLDSDFVHVLDYFNNKDKLVWKQEIEGLMTRCAQLGWSKQTAVQQMPACHRSAVDFWVDIYQLAPEGLRGRPKLVNVLETFRNFMESGFSSTRSPLVVCAPASLAAGQPVPDWSFQVSVGMTRNLAAKLAVELAIQLSEADLSVVLLEVTSCLQVKATIEPAQPDIFAASMRSKFIISESTRPDVIQLYTGLCQMFSLQGKKYTEHISSYIAEFNSTSKVDSARISDAETKMLLMLPAQQAEFHAALERHWDNFKIQDSGVTLKNLINTVDRVKRMDASTPGIWQNILVASAEKNTLFVNRGIQVFLRNLAEAQAGSKGKAINLRMRASKLRDNVAESYDMCCLWCHFAPEFSQKLGPQAYAKAMSAFQKGSYDREFVEKVRTQDGKLCLDDFRFLSILQGTETTVKSLQEAQVEASDALEMAKLKAWQSELLKEQKVFDEYMAKLKTFNARRLADSRTFLLEENEKFQAAAKSHMEAQCPLRFTDKKGLVSTIFQNQLTKFALQSQVNEEGVLSVFVADLTKLGTAFSKYLVDTVTVISENCAAYPRSTVALILAPNSGCWGATYSDADCEKACQQVEQELKEPQCNLVVRRVSIQFAEGSFATQSRRCGYLTYIVKFFFVDAQASVRGEGRQED